MEKQGKGAKQPSQQSNVHPETQGTVKPGVADSNSSKTRSGKQPDARSNHDKDGNGELAGRKQGRR